MSEALDATEERIRQVVIRAEPITAEELARIVARGERAYAAVVDMCSGRRRWVMSVPADPERDHDLVIGAALSDLRRLIDFASLIVAPEAPHAD